MSPSKILEEYYNPKSSASFGGITRLRHKLKNVSEKEILNALQRSSTYTKHKASRHSFQRRKVNVHTSNYLWQADLIVLIKLARQNEGKKYILTCIDTFSKKAFAVPVKNKTGKEVTEGFKTILEQAKTKPKFLQTDLGLEFENAEFKSLLNKYNIRWYFVHSDKKACIVERFNQTLMQRLQKYFDYNKTKTYVNVLNNIITSYNNSIHRSIGRTPNQVNKYNEMDVWLKINKDLYSKPYNAKNKINKDDYVRIKLVKKTFQKGYDQSFSNNLYRVAEILPTKPVTYKLIDTDGDSLLGIFYQSELSKVIV